jgi:1-deoxy-D-xylulose-5-phosphate reductoisomerase
MAKRVTILGSTGSIGESTLQLIRDSGADEFDVVCLTACNNVKTLAAQALEFKPEMVVLAQDAHAEELRELLKHTNIEISIGRTALIEAGAWPSDFVMAAIVGAAGLEPTLSAVKRGAHIGLANKECLVCAGDLFMRAAHKYGATILPVDSEHNAIFQVLNPEHPAEVKKLILTASGGPFRTLSPQDLQNVTKERALNHPVWSMGEKISIDSATLMNKGLELIEAHYLFDMPEDKIDIIVHPQSIVHSMVEYVDGSVLAQMGSPDMRIPISYALAWPYRMVAHVQSLDLAAIGRLEFQAPDAVKFPALRLAREALKTGGQAPIVLNAANEIAVAAFLEEIIPFMSITACIESVLNTFKNESSFATPPTSIEEVLNIDSRARSLATKEIREYGHR